MNQIETVFANLDRWRHLPNYQLERRADIFFSVYLKGLMEEVTGVALDDAIIPELPLKQDASASSDKVDYVLFSKERTKVFFIELKTDAGSHTEKQRFYLERARDLGFRKIVEGLCSIVRKTEKHQKYHHLMSTLAGLGYVTMPDDIREYLYPRVVPGLSARLRQIQPSAVDSTVEVWFIQPGPCGDDRCPNVVDFSRFAEFVERHDDPLSRVFGAHLRKWKDAAGACVPADERGCA